MTRAFKTHPQRIAVVVFTLLMLVFTGCGGNDDKSSNDKLASGANSEIVALLPKAVKDKGTLIVGSDATYPPNEFIDTDGKTVIGMDADLAKALGKVMGLKVSVRNATFDSILPSLTSGKFDLGMSSFTDTKEREETVDFVTYFSAGTSFYVNAEGGPDIQTLTDLCGRTVAVEKGTTQQTDVEAQIKKCKEASKEAPTLKVFPDQNGANLAISSGRAEVGMADSPVAAYIVKQSDGQFKLSGDSYGTAPYGIAIPKDNGMAEPLKAAMEELISNGKYMEILNKWGVQSGAIETPEINGATS